MRTRKKILILLAFILFLGLSYFYFYFSYTSLSQAQQHAVSLFGDPAQFIITHLPQDGEEGPQLARYEVWYYSSANNKLEFLAGKLLSSSPLEGAEDFPQTTLKPEDFDFYIGYEDLIDIFGIDNLELLDLPPFSSDEIKTYVNEEALFVLEHDQLTFMQTLAIDENDPIETEEQEIETVDQDYKIYSSSDFGFEISYPKDWFLEFGILTNYPTTYLEDGGTLPEKILKCDFINYSQSELELENIEILQEQPVSISTAQAVEPEDMLGYGDNMIFLFEDKLALICFFYDESFQNDLTTMFNTFKFLPSN
jgi:hypothetical protein